MAGGPNAQVVACLYCVARAERIKELSENDYYRCEAGHEFGIDWSYDDPPAEPQWPLSAEKRRRCEERARAWCDALAGKLPDPNRK